MLKFPHINMQPQYAEHNANLLISIRLQHNFHIHDALEVRSFPYYDNELFMPACCMCVSPCVAIGTS